MRFSSSTVVRRLDAQQDILCHRIFLPHIMRRRWSRQMESRLLHEAASLSGIDACFFLQPLILQFQVKITLAEDLQHFQCFCSSHLRNRRLIDLCGTSPARHADKAIRPSLILPAVHSYRSAACSKSHGGYPSEYDLHQIFISLIVFCQQYQVPHPLILVQRLCRTRYGQLYRPRSRSQGECPVFCIPGRNR